MTFHAQRQPASKAASGLLPGLSVWALVLFALSTVPLDKGAQTGVFTPTGLLMASAEPHEPDVVFERQLLPR